jgi:hypothetical protein
MTQHDYTGPLGSSQLRAASMEKPNEAELVRCLNVYG